MNILTIENLYKSYGEKILFNDITFSVSETDKIGLIGVNGTGKSSLLKVIAGLDSAEKGTIDHPNDYQIEYLPQDPVFLEDLSVLEQVFFGNSPIMRLFRDYEKILLQLELEPENASVQKKLFSLQQEMDALSAWEANSQAKTILSKFGISNYDEKVSNLSGGQRKRVALAQALIQPANLLILDEPTNHIDNETIIWLEEHLSKYTGAILLVTHDRYFLNRVTNKILELDNGNLYSYDGNFEYFLEKKLEREEKEQSSEEKRQNLLRREIAWLKRGAKARTTKQKARIDRVEDLKEQKTVNSKDKLDIGLNSTRIGKKVFELNNLTMSYEDKMLFSNFSYIVGPDDRIGIVGPNGVGKTTLLKLLVDELTPSSGTIDKGQTIKIGYYKQENYNIDENMRVIDYIKEGSNSITTKDGKTLNPTQLLDRFLFSKDMQWSIIRKLSGGEKKRLYLLRTLIEEPNVLLLDEPTNDLDIQTLNILEDYLEQFNGVVITVSHDRYFLDKVAENLLIITQDGSIEKFIGLYSDYLERNKTVNQGNKESQKKEIQKQTQNVLEATNIPRKLTYKEQKEWEEIEGIIADLEGKIERINQEISASGSDYTRVEKLYSEEKELTSELEKKIERWSELSELLETIAKNKSQK